MDAQRFVIGTLVGGVTLAIGLRASQLNIGAGVKIGAVVGFLLWFTADFMFYGSVT